MSLSAEAQALFDHARNMLPRWLTGGITAALEWLYAFTDIFDAGRSQGQAWIDDTYIGTATGRALDQHAKDRGTGRRSGEIDPVLQKRLQNFEDRVTDPALISGVNNVLLGQASDGSLTCTIVDLRRESAHTAAIPGGGSHPSRAFLSRGYRMAGPVRQPGQTPTYLKAHGYVSMAYIVILPYGTTAATQTAVQEYLRQSGPAGYVAIVERRLNP